MITCRNLSAAKGRQDQCRGENMELAEFTPYKNCPELRFESYFLSLLSYLKFSTINQS
jgi:hypothetical protein